MKLRVITQFEIAAMNSFSSLSLRTLFTTALARYPEVVRTGEL